MENKYNFVEGKQVTASEVVELPPLPLDNQDTEKKESKKSLEASFKVTPISLHATIELGNVSTGVIIVAVVLGFMVIAAVLFIIGSGVGDAFFK